MSQKVKSHWQFIKHTYWLTLGTSHLWLGLMKSCFDEKSLQWKAASMKSCFNEKPLQWKAASMISRFNEKPLQWKANSMKSHPGSTQKNDTLPLRLLAIWPNYKKNLLRSFHLLENYGLVTLLIVDKIRLQQKLCSAILSTCHLVYWQPNLSPSTLLEIIFF